ncbi:hypothetical protein GCM10010255_52500 [Streptomyces coeruleofuscus]|uniref:Uncharacterized protein n=1 Tax=Streptomyces coeruleofuscus TaxID=66879 RepID=A0ABP5VTB1_9ACTN
MKAPTPFGSLTFLSPTSDTVAPMKRVLSEVEDAVGGYRFATGTATGATAVTLTGYPDSRETPVSCTDKPTAWCSVRRWGGVTGRRRVTRDGTVRRVLPGVPTRAGPRRPVLLGVPLSAPTLLPVIIPANGGRLYTDHATDSWPARGG